MKSRTMLAAAAMTLGIAGFGYEDITHTTPGRDVNIGPMHVMSGPKHHVPLPSILGAIALLGGAAVLMVDKWNFEPADTL